MRVRVRSTAGTVTASLVETADLGRFDVELGAGCADTDVLNAALRGVLRMSTPDQAWVNQEWLRAEGAFTPGSSAGDAFDRMVSLAERHGWLDQASGEIAAHVVSEWSDRGVG